jgi:hypothetical protein
MAKFRGWTKFMNKIKEFVYLCSDCAKLNGAVWPEGHVATFHEGDCHFCKEKRAICCESDWNWPDRKRDRQDTSQKEQKKQRCTFTMSTPGNVRMTDTKQSAQEKIEEEFYSKLVDLLHEGFGDAGIIAVDFIAELKSQGFHVSKWGINK